MATVHSFPPIAARKARVLIVGSMPGERSLAARQYYAHPANAFWPIVARFLDVDPQAAYAARVRALRAAGIALWDVLRACERSGSLDAAIVRRSMVANDFPALFARCPDLGTVLCNGAAAHEWFVRFAVPPLAAVGRRPHVERLPSTSPAHAGLDRATKQRRWQAAVAAALQRRSITSSAG